MRRSWNGFMRQVVAPMVGVAILSISSAVTAVKIMERDVEHIVDDLETHEEVDMHKGVRPLVGKLIRIETMLDILYRKIMREEPPPKVQEGD